MTIQLVAAPTTGTAANATTVNVPRPFNNRNDDVLVAHIVSNNQNVTPPSGWTEVADNTVDVFRVQQFVKIAGPQEPTSYNFFVTSPAPLVGIMTSWHGVDNASGILFGAEATSLTHAEPFNTPDLNNNPLTGGRLLYLRASRRIDSAPGNPITFSTTAPGVTKLAEAGEFSGGNTSYSVALFADDSDFTFASTKFGIPITASPGTADTHNVVATLALTEAAEQFGPEDFYQRNASDGSTTLLAGQTITAIADGEIGDPVTGGGFNVHQAFDFETDPVDVGAYEVLWSKPFEGVDGRFGWVARIRATRDIADPGGIGITTWAILAQRNPITSA